MTDFWLRDSLYRDTAPVLLTKILQRDSYLAPIKLCTRIAKTRAKPALHRDNFLAYRDRFMAVLSSGYAYSLNRRAVRQHTDHDPHD